MKRYKVAVLGARGLVGQWFLHMLRNHPWFTVSDVTSGSCEGARYGDVTRWLLQTPMPEDVAELVLKPSDPKAIDADIVFSALPTDAAREVEPRFAREGFTVVSKSSAFRLHEKVPLVVPEINPEHLALIDAQRAYWPGALVTDPNCTTTILALPLKAVSGVHKVRRVVVTTLQSVSGAGYPGVPSVDVLGNVIPFIEGEEEKVADETRKILGEVRNGRVVEADIKVAATCTRVPVLEGHLESVYLEVDGEVRVEDVAAALGNFRGRPQELKLPTAPDKPIVLLSGFDRPQPRIDSTLGSIPGMSVAVGRLRRGPTPDSLLFLVLGHNLVRGAAGSAILLAELMVAEGVI